jgi:hypothetical protein
MTRRRVMCLAVVVALAVVGCAAGKREAATLVLPPPTSLPPGLQTGPAPAPNAISFTSGELSGDPAKIDLIRTGYNDQQLVVAFVDGRKPPPNDATDPCAGDFYAEVESRHDAVIVRLRGMDRHAAATNVACPAVGYGRLLAVTLPDPLNGRPIFDGSAALDADMPRPVIDGRPLVTPRWLPEGWIPQAESFTTRWWQQTFAVGAAEPWNELDRRPTMHVVQMFVAAGDDPIPNLATTGYLGQGGLSEIVATPTVHGQPAELRKQEGPLGETRFVVWQEGDYWFGVSATPDADLTDDALLRVAASVQAYAPGPLAFPSTTTP